jgi:urocanate hydratase
MTTFATKINASFCLFRAYPISEIPATSRQAAAIMHMIMNNLDPCVAQFPQELVTYGGNGQVFSNWVQVGCYCYTF